MCRISQTHISGGATILTKGIDPKSVSRAPLEALLKQYSTDDFTLSVPEGWQKQVLVTFSSDLASHSGSSAGSTPEIVHSHELVHAHHNAQGTQAAGPMDSYSGQNGSSNRGEERVTVGVGGTSMTAPDGTTQTVPDHSGEVPTENSLRDDLGVPRRPSY